MSILGNLFDLETAKPMLKKYMEKNKIVSILLTAKGDDFEMKNYNINVLEQIAEFKAEYEKMKSKHKKNSDLAETIELILSSRKADSTKIKEINKILDASR